MTNPLPDIDKLDSHLTIFKGSEKVVDRMMCGRCGLIHIPPLTHELHEIIVAEQKRTLDCNDCIYGNPGPHKEFVTALTQLLLDARISELERRRDSLTAFLNGTATHPAADELLEIKERIAHLKSLKEI